jgi:hypothetical protein
MLLNKTSELPCHFGDIETSTTWTGVELKLLLVLMRYELVTQPLSIAHDVEAKLRDNRLPDNGGIVSACIERGSDNRYCGL